MKHINCSATMWSVFRSADQHHFKDRIGAAYGTISFAFVSARSTCQRYDFDVSCFRRLRRWSTHSIEVFFESAANCNEDEHLNLGMTTGAPSFKSAPACWSEHPESIDHRVEPIKGVRHLTRPLRTCVLLAVDNGLAPRDQVLKWLPPICTATYRTPARSCGRWLRQFPRQYS